MWKLTQRRSAEAGCKQEAETCCFRIGDLIKQDYRLTKSNLGYGFMSNKVGDVVFYILNLDDLRFISRGNIRVRHQLFTPDLILVKIDQRSAGDQEDGDNPDRQENQEVPFALFNHSQ